MTFLKLNIRYTDIRLTSYRRSLLKSNEYSLVTGPIISDALKIDQPKIHPSYIPWFPLNPSESIRETRKALESIPERTLDLIFKQYNLNNNPHFDNFSHVGLIPHLLSAIVGQGYADIYIYVFPDFFDAFWFLKSSRSRGQYFVKNVIGDSDKGRFPL